MGVLEEVRTNAAATAGSAKFVHIDEDHIEAYVATLPIEQAKAPELDRATHFLGEPESTLAYLVTLDAINFGSGYFPHLKKRPGLSGYFSVAASLKDAWPLSAEELRRLDASDCARIFGQTTDDDSINELMGLFARALNDLGEYVAVLGGFERLVDAANGSAEQLVSVLAEMPFYQDVGFYKRAQLTAADLSIAKVQNFRDLERLTIFADNLVPHVLRVDGVLQYDPGLLERISREELIPCGSAEEREIRACALHAVELMKRSLEGVSAMQLDYLLWNRGRQPAYKAQPRHRTRTVFY